MLAKACLHFFEHLLFELLASQAPTASERFPFIFLVLSAAAGFHSPFQLLPPASGVLLNPVSPEQAVGPDPRGPMFSRGQVPRQDCNALPSLISQDEFSSILGETARNVSPDFVSR